MKFDSQRKKTTEVHALTYRSSEDSPRLLFSARGKQAEHLIDLARQKGLVLWPDEELSKRLFQMEAQSFLDETYFEVVAKILAFVYSIDTQVYRGNNEKDRTQ